MFRMAFNLIILRFPPRINSTPRVRTSEELIKDSKEIRLGDKASTILTKYNKVTILKATHNDERLQGLLNLK
jgi:hypothetical protein